MGTVDFEVRRSLQGRATTGTRCTRFLSPHSSLLPIPASLGRTLREPWLSRPCRKQTGLSREIIRASGNPQQQHCRIRTFCSL